MHGTAAALAARPVVDVFDRVVRVAVAGLDPAQPPAASITVIDAVIRRHLVVSVPI
jgi:hypothetical protein